MKEGLSLQCGEDKRTLIQWAKVSFSGVPKKDEVQGLQRHLEVKERAEGKAMLKVKQPPVVAGAGSAVEQTF